MKNQIFRSLHATVNLFHAARNLQAKRRGKHGKKRTQKEQAQKSITAAFLQCMVEVVAKDKDGTQLTGAQAIAKSIIRGAMKGNAEMVKIALALTGETPGANKALDEMVKVIIDV